MSQLQGSGLQRPLQRLSDFWLSDMAAWREESPSWVTWQQQQGMLQ
jgi:hypothetical protein